MASTLYFPYTMLLSNGTQKLMTAPLVDSLPSAPDSRGLCLVLGQNIGVFTAGAYQWVDNRNRWQFILDYQLVCEQLFSVSEAFVYLANAGDRLLPSGDSGAALVYVYRNGAQMSVFSAQSDGIHLLTPSSQGDAYTVVYKSPITPTTPAAGGGIPDAPANNTAYVRTNAAWQDIQSSLNEGTFVGQ